MGPSIEKPISPMSPTPPSFSTHARSLSAGAVLLLLASCASVDSQSVASATVSPPATWESATSSSEPLDATALANWWKRFNDPVLDQLITEALAGSPDLRTALSRVNAARATRGVQQADLLPSLSAGVSGNGQRARDRINSTTTRSESYAASLDASWQIDLFGRQRLTVAAADADLAQTAEDYYAAQVTLVADVATAYISLRSSEARLAVFERTLGTRQETLELTQWREQAGTGNALDSQQAISALEQARASIPTLQTSITEARNQLAVLSGRPPGSLDHLLTSTAANLPAVPAQLAVGIPAEALRQRPDVRASEHAIEAATARTRAAQRERFPSLSLSGSLDAAARHAGDLTSPATITAALIGGLTAPIFDGGRIRQTIALQTEQEKQAVIGYEKTVLSALAEVENALTAVQRTAESRSILQRATDAARAASSLATLEYEAGQADLLTVLDAQRTLLSLEDSSITTAANELTAHIQLYKSLGGGWSTSTAALTASL